MTLGTLETPSLNDILGVFVMRSLLKSLWMGCWYGNHSDVSLHYGQRTNHGSGQSKRCGVTDPPLRGAHRGENRNVLLSYSSSAGPWTWKKVQGLFPALPMKDEPISHLLITLSPEGYVSSRTLSQPECRERTGSATICWEFDDLQWSGARCSFTEAASTCPFPPPRCSRLSRRTVATKHLAGFHNGHQIPSRYQRRGWRRWEWEYCRISCYKSCM